MGIFDKLFRRETSKDKAKKRLLIVLAQDHVDISPEIMDCIRQDIVDVVAKYVSLDKPKINIDLNRDDDGFALEVSLPVLCVKRGVGH